MMQQNEAIKIKQKKRNGQGKNWLGKSTNKKAAEDSAAFITHYILLHTHKRTTPGYN